MPVSSPRMLLVEGPDDKHVIEQLRRSRNLAWRFDIRSLEGVDRLLENVPVRLKAFSAEPSARLGVVLDANSDIQAR